MTAQDSPRTDQPPMSRPTKSVRHDPITQDYELRVNGHLIGYAPTEVQGWERVNKLVYDLLTKNPAAALLPDTDERTDYDHSIQHQHQLGA